MQCCLLLSEQQLPRGRKQTAPKIFSVTKEAIALQLIVSNIFILFPIAQKFFVNIIN